MDRVQAKRVVSDSLNLLFANDLVLLRNDVSERAITHKLAQYVEQRLVVENIVGLHVDCEYNRNRPAGEDAEKEINVVRREWLAIARNPSQADRESEEYWKSVSTYPDIIVHQRGTNAHNALIVEVKKRSNRVGEAFDKLKLEAFTKSGHQDVYKFLHGVWIVIDTGKRIDEPNVRWFSSTWFNNGMQDDPPLIPPQAPRHP